MHLFSSSPPFSPGRAQREKCVIRAPTQRRAREKAQDGSKQAFPGLRMLSQRSLSGSLIVFSLLLVALNFLLSTTMSADPSTQQQEQGIPAVDPASAAQDQYGKMAQGAGVGAGSGAAFGGAVGAAGGPAGAVIGAAVGGLAGSVAGGVIGEQRGPGGDAIDMSRVAENLSGAQAGNEANPNIDTSAPSNTR